MFDFEIDPDALDRMAEDPAYASRVAGALKKVRAAQYALARKDPNVFVPLVLRDEETGGRVRSIPTHKAYQDIVTNNSRVVLHGHVESGKTQQLSVGRVLFEIGVNPNIRIAIICSTLVNARKIVASIKGYITSNADYKAIFPHVVQGDKWNETEITVARRAGIKDSTILAVGFQGAATVLGSRLDMVIIDDVLTEDNTRTEHGRDEVYNFVKKTLLGRMSGGVSDKIIFIGNAWHEQDAMHRLVNDGWTHGFFPVRDPVTKRSYWPERWPESRIAAAFLPSNMGTEEATRQLDCVPRSDDSSSFKVAWLVKCLKRGVGLEMLPYYRPQRGEQVFIGVDLAVGKKQRNDKTVLFTLVYTADKTKRVINIDSGQHDAMEIIRRVFDNYIRYNPEKIVIENVAAQDYLVQFVDYMSKSQTFSSTSIDDTKIDVKSIPLVPFGTSGTGDQYNKNHPVFGVIGLAAEMACEQWVIPCRLVPGVDIEYADKLEHFVMEPEVAHWVNQMKNYSPQMHTGDSLMASWFAREGAHGRFDRSITNVQESEARSLEGVASVGQLRQFVAAMKPSDVEASRDDLERKFLGSQLLDLFSAGGYP